MPEEEEKGKKSKDTPKHILQEMPTLDNAKNTLIKSVTQIGLTVVGGTVLTTLLGKPSFLLGASLVGAGNYKEISWLAPLGTGMMASALMQPEEPTSTTPFSWADEQVKIKKRFVGLKESFMSKTYLDKVFTSTTSSPSTGGNKSSQRTIESGNASEEDGNVNGIDDLSSDTETLDKIEQQLIASAREFQKKQNDKQVQGVEPDLMGLNDEVDFTHM